MAGQRWISITGVAASVEQIPAGYRPYLVSVATGGAAATLQMEGYAAITIPANSSFTFGGDDFPNEYVGPINITIGGAPTSWVIAYGDPEITKSPGGPNQGGGNWPPDCYP